MLQMNDERDLTEGGTSSSNRNFLVLASLARHGTAHIPEAGNVHRKITEDSMRKSVLALVSAVALGTFAASGANAMPIGSAAPTASGVEQVRLVCNEWGRCWHRPDYDRVYRPRAYFGDGYERPRYRYYRDRDYGPRYYHRHDNGRHRGWHHDD